MKSRIILFTILAQGLFAGGVDSLDSLVSEIRTAIEAKDAKRIEALTYDVGMSANDKKLSFSTIPDAFFTIPTIKVEAASLDEENNHEFFIHKGKKYTYTFKPIGKIKIYQKNDKFSTTGGLLYAIINEHYYLVNVKSENIDWKGPADKSIGWMLKTFSQDTPKIRYKYNVSGVDMDDTSESSNSSFWGQRIDEVSFESISDDFQGEIIILEKGEEVDRSELFKGKGLFAYKRKKNT